MDGTFVRLSPVLAQHALVSVYGWELKRKRYGGNFRQHLSQLLESRILFACLAISEVQNDLFRALIRHCYANCSALRKSDARLQTDATGFPIIRRLGKTSGAHQGVCSSARRAFLRAQHTGVAMRNRKYQRNDRNAPSERSRSRQPGGEIMQRLTRLKLCAGVDPEARSATFAGRVILPADRNRPPFWRYNLASTDQLVRLF